MTSQRQVERMLTMIPYLVNNPGVSVERVAADFGIADKQVVKDLTTMWMVGLPGGLPDDLIEIDMEAVEEEGVIKVSNADYLSRPMRFRLDEAAALIVALQTVRELAVGEQRVVADQVLDKLLQLTRGVSDEQLSQTIAIAVESGSDEVRGLISAGIDSTRKLRLTYDGAARGATTEPIVEPARIVMRGGIAYLQAWDDERADWRAYRLDRIAAAEVLDEAFEARTPPDVDDDWFTDLAIDQVSLTLAPRAAWVKEYHPTRSVEQLADGVVRVTMAVSHASWLTSLLLTLGDGVLGVDPPEAAAGAVAAAQDALTAYE